MKFADLTNVKIKAFEILSKLKARYPKMEAYLVYSSRFGQAEMTRGPITVFSDFPQMFCETPEKRAVLQILGRRIFVEQQRRLIRSREQIEGIDSQLERFNSELNVAIPMLDVKEDVQVELRFDQLRYQIIWQVQSDPMIDARLTPQTRASIQIVLGTLSSLT